MPAVPASAARTEAAIAGAAELAALAGEPIADGAAPIVELEALEPAELLCGPGARMAEFARVALALDASEHARAPAHFEQAEALLEPRSAHGVLLLDLDALAREDWGYARRFLRLHPAWTLRCCGTVELSSALAYFALDERARLAWPPDLEQCRALREAREAAPGEVFTAASAPVASAPAAAQAPLVEPEPPRAHAVGGPFDGGSLEDCATALASAEPTDRLELSFTRLIEELDRQGGLSPIAQACAHEVRTCVERARLERGSVLPREDAGETAAHELSAVVEERLARLAPMPETAVRFLPRVRGPLHVLAQRTQLARALDELLAHARGSAQAGTLVRVRGRRNAERPGRVELELEYVPPAGTLALPDRRALGSLGELVCERSPTGRALLRFALPAAGA